MSKLTEAQSKIQELEATIAALTVEIEAEKAKNAKPVKTTAAERKAKAAAEKSALSAHLTDEQLAEIAKSDATNPYAALAVVQPVTSRRSTKSSGERKEPVHLKDEQILEIVKLYDNGNGLSKAEIARHFNVHPAFVGAVVSGKQHSKITGIIPADKK